MRPARGAATMSGVRSPTRSIRSAGWGNWEYARTVPIKFQSIPRTMSLTWTPEGYRMVQRPVPQMESLRGEYFSMPATTIEGQLAIGRFLPLR